MFKRKDTSITSSLNIRLINLMVIFALTIIAAFTTIQVYNQIRNATNQNLYQSKLSSIIIYQSVEQTLQQALAKGKGRKELLSDFQDTLKSLIESSVSDEIYIVDKRGKVIAQDSSDGSEITPSIQDMERIQNIIDLNAHDSWSYPFIDRDRNTMETLLPITVDNQVAFVVKTFYRLGNIQDALKAVYIPILVTVGVIIFLSISNTLTLSRKIVKPIKTLNTASKQIADGDLALKVYIDTNDEIEELSNTFNDMTRQLTRMKDIAENANPLTKLPGNNIIHEEIDKRIDKKKKFVVVHSDLDNFKVFNDSYGIGAGDVAIRLTSELIKESIRKFGCSDDFVGHEGGDDFVIITTPETLKPITDYFLPEFDKRSKQLYSEKDQKLGYIMGKERRAEARGGEASPPPELTKFPLMSISLAALSSEDHPFESYADITNRMVTIKKEAKRKTGSNLVLVKI